MQGDVPARVDVSWKLYSEEGGLSEGNPASGPCQGGLRASLNEIVVAARLSRMYGGLHYRFDITVGEELGGNAGAWAIKEDCLPTSPLRSYVSRHSIPAATKLRNRSPARIT